MYYETWKQRKTKKQNLYDIATGLLVVACGIVWLAVIYAI